jgi:hypothetical protein
MNTTDLIGHWNMDGARRDLAGRFAPVADIRAILLGDEHPRQPSGAKPLLMKSADEEDWRPLLGSAT